MTVEGELLVSVIVWLLWVPIVTLPKFSVVGLTANCPLATPVPVSESELLGSEALLLMVAVALKAPAALGVKTTLTWALWPAKIAIGRAGALSEKYLLEMEALLTVTEAAPVFVRVAVSVLLVPAATLPKSRVAPLKERVPDADCCVAVLLELNP